ncbi:exported hypothetical protein [Tenacibaculum sediminilitoris]|uniref:retropepsin-like aspartic protease n=1 Tax=Tenacibaculum sediminilitoris TaxID=1820334 RepID=UPI0038933A1B
MKHLLLLLMTLTFSISACQSKQSNSKQTINETLEHLTLAVNSRNYDAISNYLSEDYQYEGMARPRSITTLKQVIQQFPKIESLVIDKTSIKEDEVLVDVTIKTAQNSTKKTIILDNDYKIIRADIAAISMQGHSASSNSKTKKANKNTTYNSLFKSMPFHISENQIVVEATINGKKGNLVVDSGTPMALMLNSKFQSYNRSKSKKNPMDVSGEMSNTYKVNIESFEWNGLVFNNVESISTNLDDLGRRLKVKSFAGTIGYALLKQFIIDFDYENNQLKLWTDRDLIKKHYDIKPEQIVPFTMAHHLPVIKAKIGDKEFRFGLDSGAETNMIDPRWKDDLEGKYEIIGMTELYGASTSQRKVLKVSMSNFILNKESYTMNFMFAELYGGQHEATMIDGLIGSQFLAHRKTIVNYIDNELYIIN